MSICVTVKNDDSREGAVIGVKTRWFNTDGTVGGEHSEVELKGGPDGSGESKQMLVHGSQELVVREIRQP
jgi:hypothetical protein